MKELNGRDIADFVKERQAAQVRSLRGAKIFPKLAIFYDNDSPVIAKYMQLKQRYGEDLRIDVEVIRIADTEDARTKIRAAAADDSIQGMIVQLPLSGIDLDILEEIPAAKDVDGLRKDSNFSATAMAIHWLLTSYGVDLPHKKLAIVGQGKLVGKPLTQMWHDSNYDLVTFDKGDNLNKLTEREVIVTATGVPGVIKSEMLAQGAIVVDAGTASEGGVIKGDLDEAVRERSDLTMTPKIGGVGPLTVAMLFEQLLQACEKLRNK